MVHQITTKIISGAVAYITTDDGKNEYNELFPNNDDQNVYLKAKKYLDFYIGLSRAGKYNDLSSKLGHSADYNVQRVKSNYRTYVSTAAVHLHKQAQTPPPPTTPVPSRESQPIGSTAALVAPTQSLPNETSIIEVGNVDETCNGLRAENAQLKEKLRAAQLELKERDEEHDTAKARWQQAYKKLKSKAEKEISVRNAKIRTLHTELSSAQEKHNDIMLNLSSSLSRVISMEKINSKIVTKLRGWKNRTDETTEDLQAQIDEFRSEFLSKLEDCEGVVEKNQDENVERFVNLESDLKDNRDELHYLENEVTNQGNAIEKVQEQATTTSNDVHDLQIARAANGPEGGEEDLGDSQTSKNHLTSNEFVAGVWTTHLTVANERTKTTSRRGRTVILSEKAQDLVLVNDKDARSASKVSSNADRIKGRNLGEQVSQCDFENIASINTCFPSHKLSRRGRTVKLSEKAQDEEQAAEKANYDSSDDDQSVDLLSESEDDEEGIGFT
eukprot:scaffold9611_cov116-Skeletonema_dohrnii-CCMP3373.AAC.4